jgi:hypothetical protein
VLNKKVKLRFLVTTKPSELKMQFINSSSAKKKHKKLCLILLENYAVVNNMLFVTLFWRQLLMVFIAVNSQNRKVSKNAVYEIT